jgi:hypothetical protein
MSRQMAAQQDREGEEEDGAVEENTDVVNKVEA